VAKVGVGVVVNFLEYKRRKVMPVKKEVTASLVGEDKKTKTRTCTILVDFGETAVESIKLFNDDAVNSNAFANGRVTIQAGIRSMMKAGKSDEEIQAAFSVWKLGVAREKGVADPVASLLGRWDTYSEKEQADILSKLSAKKTGKS